ncbi:MAG: DUF3667 domain-containing protein [Brevundimonas sp.]|uniref:DUF3667 domain-containing protein n=1 Tax=Brevundimonas sp. TaxID=1871086 RepID=UPI00391BB724
MTGEGADRCADCSASLHGRFCHLCGHDSRPPPRRLRDLADDLLDNVFSFTTALPVTLKSMLLTPGAVPRAHMDGDRSRFLSPVKLYVTASLIFFLFMGLTGVVMLQVRIEKTGDPWVRIANDEIFAGGFHGLPYWLQRPTNEAPDSEILAALEAASRQQEGADDFDRSSVIVLREFIQNPASVNNEIATWMPRALWLLMPVYALLLWPLYARGRLLIEHVIFSLWAHSLMFILLVLGAIWNFLGVGHGLLLAFALYQVWITRGLRGYYGSSWKGAVLKGAALNLAYLFLLWLPLIIAFAMWQASEHVPLSYWFEE